MTALLALQVGYFVHFLNQFQYLPGTDAYYYALQTQSLLDSGHLKVPDAPVPYYLMAVLCRTGASIEGSFKILLSAIFVIYAAGLWCLMDRLKQASFALGLLVTSIGVSVIAFHVVEFPRLSLGLATVPFWFLFLLAEKKGRILWLALLLVACSFLHVALLFLALTFVVTVAIGKAGVNSRWTRVLSAKTVILVLGGCVVLVAVISRMWPGLWLRIAELRFGVPGIVAFLGHENNVPRDLKIVVPIIWLLLVFIFVASSRKVFGRWTYLTIAVLSIPLWPSSDSSLFGLSGRLAALFVLLAIPLTLVLLSEMPEQVKAHFQSSRSRCAFGLAAVVLAGILPVRMSEYRGLLGGYDYGSYERAVADLVHDRIPMLIAHRGLDFFYSYRLRRDAFHFDPAPGWKRSDIWRIALRITPEEVAYYSPPTCLWGETARTIPATDYLLVREDCWEQLRANVSRKDNPDLYVELWENAENPSGERPTFLRSKHRDHSVGEFPIPGQQR